MVYTVNIKKLDIIPSNVDLAGAEIEIVELEKREYNVIIPQFPRRVDITIRFHT